MCMYMCNYIYICIYAHIIIILTTRVIIIIIINIIDIIVITTISPVNSSYMRSRGICSQLYLAATSFYHKISIALSHGTVLVCVSVSVFICYVFYLTIYYYVILWYSVSYHIN